MNYGLQAIALFSMDRRRPAAAKSPTHQCDARAMKTDLIRASSSARASTRCAPTRGSKTSCAGLVLFDNPQNLR